MGSTLGISVLVLLSNQLLDISTTTNCCNHDCSRKSKLHLLRYPNSAGPSSLIGYVLVSILDIPTTMKNEASSTLVLKCAILYTPGLRVNHKAKSAKLGIALSCITRAALWRHMQPALHSLPHQTRTVCMSHK
ncbi:hypothetical protein K435DRAFT_514808 [Dendrothele bispora CBS 962.96]|uniref:Secreted protein n=1 Tax=Dendrothele bispora (strain CBS 962.96) TaxID=1314807 RepID=A0A4S8M9D5_DENBC|nr:hypothetical protein K435DRAFT_514808 [Dendrothele bispora CBS 962.96]